MREGRAFNYGKSLECTLLIQHCNAENSSKFVPIKEVSYELGFFSSLQGLFISYAALLLHTLLDICQEGDKYRPHYH